jgi:hypothetical protein
MEIELDLRGEERYTWYAMAATLTVLVLVGLGYLGMPVTPYDGSSPRALGWADWRFLQAEREYRRELDILRSYADQLSDAINTQPSPVAVQILAERVSRQTTSGDPALEAARTALDQAAMDVRNWSTGILDRDKALISLQLAIELLQ